MNLKSLGCSIKEARLARGMTLKSLAKATGVDHSQISRIERGENALVSRNVQKICKFLHVSEVEPVPQGQGSGAAEKMRSMIEEWPQCERLLCGILDSMREAYESQVKMAIHRSRK
ncbi:helix-turn-helix domain-containing protein [Pseudomonas sp. NPDC099000]|uniref:helix-turn-helix domain-containing protein n=1 Tax=Pseudomonas sp. NPDC099000 TaxID=3364488 RepID=UPI003839EA73